MSLQIYDRLKKKTKTSSFAKKVSLRGGIQRVTFNNPAAPLFKILTKYVQVAIIIKGLRAISLTSDT